MLTHGHPDHIGGNVDREGKPAFPNARYVMWKDEWNFWASNPNLAELMIDVQIKEALITVSRTSLPPIQDQLDLIENETEIVPDIRDISARGHTPGQMTGAISSKGEQPLYISDVAIHPIHLEHPD